MDDIFIWLGKPLFVEYVPAQGFKEGVNELTPELGFFVCTGMVGFAVSFKTLDEVEDGGWCGHIRIL